MFIFSFKYHQNMSFVKQLAKKSIDLGSNLAKKTDYKTYPEINLVDMYLCIIKHQWVKED